MSDTTNIGLIHSKELPKDAIHIAIAQVSAGEDVRPGDEIGFKEKEGIAYRDAPAIGIVDPFIKDEIVYKDRLFYMFLKPNSVTSLTHEWTHPMFNRSLERIEAAQKWLEKECAEYWDEDYPEATNHQRFIEEFNKGDVGYYAYGTDFTDKYRENEDGFRKKFWDNLEIVTGKVATPEQRAQQYFTCSC